MVSTFESHLEGKAIDANCEQCHYEFGGGLEIKKEEAYLKEDVQKAKQEALKDFTEKLKLTDLVQSQRNHIWYLVQECFGRME